MNKSYSGIWALFKKDLLLEWRQQYTFYGILLYVACSIFVIYMAMGQPDSAIWSGLFWVTQLFICTNAVAKSFLQESRGRMLYFYLLVHPRDFVLSKLLFNSVLMVLMSFISLCLFLLLLGNPLEKVAVFAGIAVFGGWSLSLVFSFLAAIAAKAQQQAAIMAILGFPLIIPQLLLLMKISNLATGAVQSGADQMLLLLAGLDLMVIALAIILFPFLWKD